MTDCPCETQSQHYDPSRSLGTITNSEEIIYLITNDMPFDPYTKELTPEAFPKKKLIDRSFSVARKQYSSLADLEKWVIKPLMQNNVTVVGFSLASAKEIRKVDFQGPNNTKIGRAFCVVDLVEKNDHDSHAIICFSNAGNTLKPAKKGVYRIFAMADLAGVFSPVRGLDKYT